MPDVWGEGAGVSEHVILVSGKKKVYTTTVAPLFSRSVARLRGHRAKKAMVYIVYHFPGKTREKGIHHRSGKKDIHHRASNPEKEKKEGLQGGGVYFFLPCVCVSYARTPSEWCRDNLSICPRRNVMKFLVEEFKPTFSWENVRKLLLSIKHFFTRKLKLPSARTTGIASAQACRCRRCASLAQANSKISIRPVVVAVSSLEEERKHAGTQIARVERSNLR